jgi:hypothetical protein
MTKQLILKDLSKLVQRYTPKQGVLIQSLPQDEIFEYPKSDTTRIYRVKNYDVPIVEKTPAQAPPLPISLLMDLKKYLKDAKSKEIINQYIEQTKQLQLEYEEPIRPIEEEKKKAQKTIEKENQKAIQGAPLALKAKEKSIEDMDEKELALFIKRSDISVSDKKKAAKLMIKLQQKPKEKLAIEAAPKAKAEPKPVPKAESKPAPKVEAKPELTKEQAIEDIKQTFLDKTPVVEAITAETTKKAEERDQLKKEILKKVKEIYKFKDTLPFETQEDFDEYLKQMEKTKKDWKDIGGNTSTISTPLNNLKKLFKAKLEALEAERIKAEQEAQAKAERKAAKKAARKAQAEAETEAPVVVEEEIKKQKKATPKPK